VGASLDAFLDDFVLPLFRGGTVRLKSPLSSRDLLNFERDVGPLRRDDVQEQRLRCGNRRVESPLLPEIDTFELVYWMGLHNLLFFDHPQLGQVWASDTKWRVVEATTASFLDRGQPDSPAEVVARDVAMEAIMRLTRVDQVIETREAEIRYFGQPAPRRIGLFDSVAYLQREETINWLDFRHSSPAGRLLPRAFRSSPLTALIHADRVHGRTSLGVVSGLLAEPAYARAVVYAWAGSERWDLIGAAVLECVFDELGIGIGSEHGPPTDAAASAADREASDNAVPTLSDDQLALHSENSEPSPLVAALIHLHILKVLEMKTRAGLSASSSSPAWKLFFGLPLLLESLAPTLGDPAIHMLGAAMEGRWTEYRSFVRGIITRDELRWMRDTFAPALTQDNRS